MERVVVSNLQQEGYVSLHKAVTTIPFRRFYVECGDRPVEDLFLHANTNIVTAVFFPISVEWGLSRLMEEYVCNGAVPDVFAVTAANRHKPDLSDTHPNFSLWQSGGKCFSLAFRTASHTRNVIAAEYHGTWPKLCWAGGRLK